jgi:3-hydroxyisobutyrate dehydrogenase/2-hydroxy-3-oxopropionate reductase
MGLKVGFLGLGSMGSLMAANIARGGFRVSLYNRTRSKAESVASEVGAQVCDTPAQVARRCEVIFTMVSDSNALRDLYLGPDGISQGLWPSTTCVEMSTVGPAAIRQLCKDLMPTGARLLDIPVSGSLVLAREGKLTLMAGGSPADLEYIRPILSTMATRIFHVGPLGSGATMKLAVNAIVYGLNAAVSEALVLAESAGISRETAYEIFANSAIAAPFVQYRRDAFLHQQKVPVGFPLDLAAKDLELIQALAAEVHAPMPQVASNQQTLKAAVQEGRGRQDVTEIAEHLRHLRAHTRPDWVKARDN